MCAVAVAPLLLERTNFFCKVKSLSDRRTFRTGSRESWPLAICPHGAHGPSRAAYLSGACVACARTRHCPVPLHAVPCPYPAPRNRHGPRKRRCYLRASAPKHKCEDLPFPLTLTPSPPCPTRHCPHPRASRLAGLPVLPRVVPTARRPGRSTPAKGAVPTKGT